MLLLSAPAHTKRNGIAIFFNLTSAYASELIHSVELWLYKRRSHDHSNHTYVVSKLPDRHSHNRKKKPVDLASERVGKDPGWIEFKDATLRDKIMRWVVMANRFPNPLGTEGHLIITCPTCGDETPPIILEGDKKPFLAVNFKKIKKRYKRQAQWCQSNQNSCCKKMFKFNFHEAGLAAFLEPREYQPNYCRGSCEVRQYPGKLYLFIPKTAHQNYCYTDTMRTLFSSSSRPVSETQASFNSGHPYLIKIIAPPMYL